MGASQGQPAQQSHGRVYDAFCYAPTPARKKDSKYSHGLNLRPSTIKNPGRKLLNTPYYGSWSMRFCNTVSPSPRIGQCSVYDPVNNALIIAYGLSATGKYLNDAWALSLTDFTWKKLSDALLSPRAYSSAVLVGRRMFVYGGALDGELFADLHWLDLDTGEVMLVNVSGDVPGPRTGAGLFASAETLYLWSGWNGQAQGSMYSCGANEYGWRRCDLNCPGVPAPSCCWHKGKYYIYGGENGATMSVFDPETGETESISCIGAVPSQELAHATLVSLDEYVMLIGGESTSKYMYVYALDVRRKWWFAFHVRPDNQTLALSDGVVNKMGLFMLPREHSASIVYSAKERRLVSVMGSRLADPVPVFTISVGEALSVLHLRNDMLDLFTVDHGQRE